MKNSVKMSDVEKFKEDIVEEVLEKLEKQKPQKKRSLGSHTPASLRGDVDIKKPRRHVKRLHQLQSSLQPIRRIPLEQAEDGVSSPPPEPSPNKLEVMKTLQKT